MIGRVASRLVRPGVGPTVPLRRAMGGAPKKAATPYDIPKGQAYPDQAYPLGLTPDWKPQGWEGVTIVTYIACTVAIVFGVGNKEDDSFKGWCRREALAREKHEENGGEVEFGKYYSAPSYTLEEGNLDAMPVVSEE